AAGPEHLLRLVVGQRPRVGLAGGGRVGDHRVRDLGDVLAAVPVLGRLQAAGAREQGPREAVDLRAVVVEVVLARHVRAARLEDARERVADGRPADAADVDRARGVGGDELEVDLLAGLRVAATVRGARLDDRARELARGGGVERDVEEAGAGDVHGLDARRRGEAVGEVLGERARRRARLLRELQRDVRGPVAVLPLAGSLHVDALGDRGRVQV